MLFFVEEMGHEHMKKIANDDEQKGPENQKQEEHDEHE